MPQSRNRLPIFSVLSSPRALERAASIADMLLPPAPPTSMADAAGAEQQGLFARDARACFFSNDRNGKLGCESLQGGSFSNGAAIAFRLRGFLQAVHVYSESVCADHVDGAL